MGINPCAYVYFLDFFTTAREASALDCDTIGGTWGTATSRHAKGEHKFSHAAVGDIVGDVVQQVRQRDPLMANYVAMYFDDLFQHITQLKRCLTRNAVCAYVVGNSRIKQTMIETDLLLLELFEALGFRKLRLEQIRRRNSGQGLHETIVIVERRV